MHGQHCHAMAEALRLCKFRGQSIQMPMDARLEGAVGSAARVQDSSWTTAVRLRGEFTCGAVAAQELLDTRKADAKDAGDRLLRAQPALTGMQDFLS
jgi:hypothetical protein